MAAEVLRERSFSSAHWSSEAAARTDFSEQPETPGPQPRHGAKASSVPEMEKSAFSSKVGWRPEVAGLGGGAGDALAGGRRSTVGRAAAAGQQTGEQRSTEREGEDTGAIHKGSSFYGVPGKCSRGVKTNVGILILVYCSAGRLSIGARETNFKWKPGASRWFDLCRARAIIGASETTKQRPARQETPGERRIEYANIFDGRSV